MPYTIQKATAEDYAGTERLAFEAFQDRSRLPGSRDEHYLLHQLRQSDAYLPDLDYIALAGEDLVGQITYTLAEIRREDGTVLPVCTLGPLCVHPAWQSKGVGSALVRHTLDAAKRQGFGAVILFGHPEYYPRFGFVPAEKYGIRTAQDENFDAFMALELQSGALAGAEGRFYDAEVFHGLAPEDVDAFTKELFG